MSKERSGKSALLLAAFLWGFGFVAVQSALDNGWTPFGLLAIRGFLAGGLFGVLSWKRQWWRKKKLLQQGVFAGFLMFLAFVLQTYGQNYSSPANAAFLTTLYVIFTPFLVRIIYKIKLQPRVFIAAVIAIGGLAALNLGGGYQLRLGDILLLLCAFVFALHILALEKLGEYDDSLSITAIQTLTMGVLSLVAMLWLGESFSASGWPGVLYSGLISSGVAFFLQAYGQKQVNASLAALILTLEAVFGVICSVLILHEQLSVNMIIGGILLLLAVVIVEWKPK